MKSALTSRGFGADQQVSKILEETIEGQDFW